MSFRLVGIKVLSDCDANIRKRLKGNRVFLFSSLYSEDCGNELLLARVNSGSNSIINNLYNIESDFRATPLEISVGAIVGKNGDGKSSIIEIILRVLNNFAYSFGFRTDQPSLRYVDGVHAIVYYDMDGAIYAIRCTGRETKWYRDGQELEVCEDPILRKQSLKEHFSEGLFYTMVINYSLYSYSGTSLGNYGDNDRVWIEEVFHKNDSYQTPVVINPMRTKGNIDINREAYLSRQRLLSIFSKSVGGIGTNKISPTETAIGYAFSLRAEDKFISSFTSTLIEYSKDELKWKDFKPDSFYPGFISFWLSFRSELKQNPNLINLCSRSNIPIRRASVSDFRKYVTQLVHSSRVEVKENRLGKEIKMLTSSSGDLSLLNFRQFYRLLVVLMVWKVLTKSNKFAMESARLDKVLEAPKNPRNAAMLYILYKFISIVETYPGLCQGDYLKEDYSVLIKKWPNPKMTGAINRDAGTILSTYDYRTIKIRQTINYLRKNEDYYNAEECSLVGIDYDYYLPFEMLSKQLQTYALKDVQWHLPCPIFEGDIVVDDGREQYLLSMLSSGMLQRLNTVGSLIYHLRNLDDEQKANGMIAYNYISVILEEVELYYHPEYQKNYISYLLEQISQARLIRIKGINFLFITHSPFILSDILRNQILCLDDGDKATCELRTFGANIHDMLRHPFFMRNGTIGDFSQKIINRIIVCLVIYEEIRKVGEEVFNWAAFKKCNEELSGYLDFVPCKEDGTIDLLRFKATWPKECLSEAISFIDEPIVKDALNREYKRIVL